MSKTMEKSTGQTEHCSVQPDLDFRTETDLRESILEKRKRGENLDPKE